MHRAAKLAPRAKRVVMAVLQRATRVIKHTAVPATQNAANGATQKKAIHAATAALHSARNATKTTDVHASEINCNVRSKHGWPTFVLAHLKSKSESKKAKSKKKKKKKKTRKFFTTFRL